MRHLLILFLAAALAACCPAPGPAAAGAPTGVAGVVRAVATGEVTLELANGQRVRVLTSEGLEAGERIFVTGHLVGDHVEASAIRRL